MGANVFANGREISAKADGNKSIAGMPDVCLSPPSPPAGPIPIPYPNFSDASKTSSGSKTVKIGGKEVGLKNKSVYKSSKGNEAATRSFGMGVVTHKLSGATKHSAWSSDVKVEGKNVIRFLDLTTHNHSNPMNSGSTTLDVAKAKMAAGEPLNCEELSAINDDVRDKLGEKTKDQSIVGRKKKPPGAGTTVSSMTATPKSGGSSVTRSAHNNHKATEKLDSLAKGGDKAVRSGEKPTLCGNYTHPRGKEGISKKTGKPKDPGNWARQKSGHAEARLLDQVVAGAKPTNITVNIDWRPTRGKPSKMPCETCHEMLCKAKECGHDISFCDKDNNKKAMTEEHCPATKESYTKLQKTMGEFP